MKIDEWYPKPKDILDCELETLKFLTENPVINSYFSKLYSDAYQYYTRIKNDQRLKFNFESELQISMEGREGHAHIGANIMLIDKNNYEGISYSLAICNNDKPKARLLRRYHFDYALPSLLRRQPHPVFHLQYAGKLSPRLQSLNLEHQHIDAWLSEPRLCYSPMSLALLINMIFKEFPNETNIKLSESSEWRNLIRKNENLLLAPFYKICHNFISTRTSQKLFVNDFYYGN